MLWSPFDWDGKSSICFVDERMNSSGYREALKNYLVDIGNNIRGSDWIFQQDNGFVPMTKVNLTWFKSQKMNVLSWSSLSPDLNPIENL